MENNEENINTVEQSKAPKKKILKISIIIIISIILACIVFVSLYFPITNNIRTLQIRKEEEKILQQMSNEIAKTVRVQYKDNHKGNGPYTFVAYENPFEETVLIDVNMVEENGQKKWRDCNELEYANMRLLEIEGRWCLQSLQVRSKRQSSRPDWVASLKTLQVEKTQEADGNWKYIVNFQNMYKDKDVEINLYLNDRQNLPVTSTKVGTTVLESGEKLSYTVTGIKNENQQINISLYEEYDSLKQATQKLENSIKTSYYNYAPTSIDSTLQFINPTNKIITVKISRTFNNGVTLQEVVTLSPLEQFKKTYTGISRAVFDIEILNMQIV